MFSQFFEIGDNRIALGITVILSILIILLFISMFSRDIEKLLRKVRVLEEKESPKELLLWIIGIMITIRAIHILIAQPFIVDGDSMYPQLHNGEILLIDKISYHVKDPAKGDIVVFKYRDPYNKCLDTEGNNIEICRAYSKDQYDNKYLVKRIIATPNSTTTYEGKTLVTGPDQYIVMGDNRDESYDSRSWGPLDSRYISGRVMVRLLPISAFDWDPAPMSDPINLK